MSRDAQEIELRLVTTAAELKRLPGCLALAPLTVSPAGTRRLLSVYWDTPDLQLYASRLALRLRRTDGGDWVQTLKAETQDPDTRDEFEGCVNGERPDLRLAERLGWRRTKPVVDDTALRPLFRTRVVRTVRTVGFGDGTIVELATDRGEISIVDRPAKRQAIVEIELELVEGSARSLYELAYRLVGELRSARLLFASKPERGYELLTGTSPAPRRALAIDVSPKSPALRVACRAAAESLVHIQSNVECARSGDDPEGVHQMRVGVRRLRVAGTIARMFPETLETELKWLRRLLGETRDVDVFATETWPGVIEASGENRALATTGFETAIARTRAARYRGLRRALDSRRFQLLMLSVGWTVALLRDGIDNASLRNRSKRTPRRLLARRAKRTRERGEAIGELNARERHRLRIELRKLRYLAEFLAGLYPPQATRRYLRRIAAVQTTLGALNDLAVTAETVRSMASALPAKQRRAVNGLWRSHASASEPLLERRLLAAWKKFTVAAPFWS